MKKNGERSKKKNKKTKQKKKYFERQKEIFEEKKNRKKKWIILGENRTESIEIYIYNNRKKYRRREIRSK